MDFRTNVADLSVFFERIVTPLLADDLFVEIPPAVCGHAPMDVVISTKSNKVQETLLEIGLTSRKFHVIGANKLLQTQERPLPLGDGHLIPIVRTPPIVAITAFVIAPLYD